MRSDKYHIAFATDRIYLRFMGVAIYSLLCNTKEPSNLIVHILYSSKEVNPSEFDSIINFKKKFNCEIKLDNLVKFDLEDLPVMDYFNQSVYYRIILPELLPDCDRVLYLDSDLMILDDVTKLFNQSPKNCYFGAILDPGFTNHKKIGLPLGADYFNSGVLMLFLDNIRKNNISEKAINHLKNNPDKIIFPDQDALNIVSIDKWCHFPLKWNVQACFFQSLKDTYKNDDKFQEAITEPSIVHFTTKHKPWLYMTQHPYKKMYFNFFKKSGLLKNYSFPDKNFKNVIIKVFMNIKKKLKKII